MVRVIFVLFALFSFSFGNDDININSLEDLSKFAPQKETDVKKSNKRIPITFSSKEIEKKDDSDVRLDKSNVLMLGPTGSGKTLLAKTLAEILNVSVRRLDQFQQNIFDVFADVSHFGKRRRVRDAERDVQYFGKRFCK